MKNISFQSENCLTFLGNKEIVKKFDSTDKYFSQKEIFENLSEKLRGYLPKIEFYDNLLEIKIEKIAFTYPEELNPINFKQTITFQIELLSDLIREGYILSDFHPGNIAFDGNQPKLVDIESIIPIDSHITNRDLGKLISQYLFRFNLAPLFLYANGYSEKARNSILNYFNFEKEQSKYINSFFPSKELSVTISRIKNLIYLINVKLLVRSYNFKLISNKFFLSKLLRTCKKINFSKTHSDYANFYSLKKENNKQSKTEEFNSKQRNVNDILLEFKNNHSTLIDLGANTGWYSILANKIGYRTTALEIDQGCLLKLGNLAKEHNLLSLRVPFKNITVINGNDKLPFSSRNTYDVALVLGLVHHLILGEGLAFEDLVRTLDQLQTQVVVIEFVELNDAVILNEPEFFKNLNTQKSNYSIEKLTEEFFKRDYILNATKKSTPEETRKILLFTKNTDLK